MHQSDLTPLVSIIIPVYNRANLIAETLDSAIKQTYANLEIIIIDNHSIDNTWEILNQFVGKDKRIKIYQNEKNIGPVKNWVKGLEIAQGEYIKILFSDDLILPKFVENTLKVFDEDVAFVMTKLTLFSENHETISKYECSKNKKHSREYIKQMILGNSSKNYSVSPGCAIFRKNDLLKSLFTEIPNKDLLVFNKYGAGVDLLVFLITAQKYKYFMCIPEIETKFRIHKESFSISNDLSIYYDWAKLYFLKNYDRNLLPLFSSFLLIKYLLNSKKHKFKIISELYKQFSFKGLIKILYIKYISSKHIK